ncbi:MAG TPA: 50S ribosomal protein L11 methyltransferase [Myxococcaceae bacterium]|nr:50S ribosomal protein L11 methyltransferase [Myxococcaceae bacterium]
MSAVSLSLDLPEAEAERIEALLWDVGATGLEIRDREAPPMPGVRGPSPGEAIVVAWFDERATAEAALDEVKASVPGLRAVLEDAPETDWSTAWRARIRSTRVGRLWVGPPWETPPEGTVALTIEPKMAFGTGDHPTTALCLGAVEAFCTAHPGSSVLDVGTGTGVLALMARKLGAARVVGVDNDPMSVTLAQENAALNGIAGVELSGAPLDAVAGRFDLVVANILANTLVELAPALVRRTAIRLVLAGVLIHQEDEVRQAFERAGAVSDGGERIGDWVRMDFRVS